MLPEKLSAPGRISARTLMQRVKCPGNAMWCRQWLCKTALVCILHLYHFNIYKYSVQKITFTAVLFFLKTLILLICQCIWKSLAKDYCDKSCWCISITGWGLTRSTSCLAHPSPSSPLCPSWLSFPLKRLQPTCTCFFSKQLKNKEKVNITPF